MDFNFGQLNNEAGDSEKGFFGFVKIASSILLLFLLILILLFNIGEGENNLGGWLIITLIFVTAPSFLQIVIPAVILRYLLLKYANEVNKIINNFSAVVLNVGVVILASNWIPNSSVANLLGGGDPSLYVLSRLGFFAVGLIVILISGISYLFKVEQPKFWKFTLSPTILVYAIFMTLITFLGESGIFYKIQN